MIGGKRFLTLAGVLLALGLALACSSDSPVGNDPPGFSCEYDPVGVSSYVVPTPEQLGEFDFLARVRVTGHRQHTPRSSIYNQVTVEEVVFGQADEGDTLELQDEHRSCLETGETYYVLFNEH